MDGRASRAAALMLIVPLFFALALGACSPEQSPEDSSPTVTADGPDQDEGQPTEPGEDESSPDPEDDGSATPTTAPDPSTSPTPTDAQPSDDEQGSDWEPPADPDAEGPTEAPELPEFHGSADEGIILPTDVTVTLSSITTTTLTAETPGETSGPAVVVKVQVSNDSEQAQDVSSAVVSLDSDDDEVGVPTWASPYAPFDGQVAAGETVEGTYVFMLDPASGRSVTVRVNYSAGEPLAVFTGQTT
ncbi:hypothetical protein ACT3SP_09175 [Brachybacterium sp. AOP43-C2-M15]|uniref:hypothetical protein n=1 Tax=Brachybacterium sp. AOP43-C2-M15 TaxID=3457661 RepID=UPI004033217C